MQLGHYIVGVRCNSSSAAARVREIFREQCVDDIKVQDNYSLSLTEGERGPRQLSSLYVGDELVVRSRGDDRPLASLRSLLHHLKSRDQAPQITIRATLLSRSDRAIIVPAEASTAASHERVLSAAGWTYVVEPDLVIEVPTTAGLTTQLGRTVAWLLPEHGAAPYQPSQGRALMTALSLTTTQTMSRERIQQIMSTFAQWLQPPLQVMIADPLNPEALRNFLEKLPVR